MRNLKDLLLDIDGVYCFPNFLDAINDFLGSDYVIDDFSDYYMDREAIPKERFNEFNNFLNNRNLYQNAQVLPYAKEVLKDLNLICNIYVCSSCINPFDITRSGKLFADKYNFLMSSMPFIKPEHFIFTNAKHLFRADIQIDDRLSNLNESIETKILFPSYHNKLIQDNELIKKGILRAGYDWKTGWLELAKILLEPSQIKDDQIKRYLLK